MGRATNAALAMSFFQSRDALITTWARCGAGVGGIKARAGAARRRAMMHFMVVMCSGRTGLACVRRAREEGRKERGGIKR